MVAGLKTAGRHLSLHAWHLTMRRSSAARRRSTPLECWTYICPSLMVQRENNSCPGFGIRDGHSRARQSDSFESDALTRHASELMGLVAYDSDTDESGAQKAVNADSGSVARVVRSPPSITTRKRYVVGIDWLTGPLIVFLGP